MRFRISIAGLLVLILFLAVVFASLREATDLWAKAMLSLAIAVYGVALLGMLFRRATGTGAFVLGAGYLALCVGPWCHTEIMPRLLTTAVIDDLYLKMDYTPRWVGERVWAARMPDDDFVAGRVFQISTGPVHQFHVESVHGTTARYGATQLRAIGLDAYRQLCHADLSLLFAFIGAMIARRFAAREESTARPPS
jgi:hypothetical protein